MKKRVITITVASILALGLSACTLAPESKFAVDAISEIVDQLTDDTDLADEPTKELPQADNNIIDFTFTQAISSTLPPFAFHISGEIFGEIPYKDMLRVKIESIQVSNTDGALIQKISIDAWPRNALENNRYGLEFNDYNCDGYLDISIRRFPGDSDHDRTYLYWLWDNEAQQFAYDWKLSEVVTEENLIDFTVTQSIHDEIAPLTVRLLGRWIEGWSSDIQGTADNLDANIHVIQIINNDGRIIQEFDRLGAIPPRYESSFGLHFADYNFDGYLDMALYMFEGGSMRNEPHIYWLWDNTSEQFVENEELTEFSDSSAISINSEENRLECYTRFGAGMGITQHFEYIDGSYIFVYSIEWGYEPDPNKEGEYIRYEIIKELIDGEIITTENYYDD